MEQFNSSEEGQKPNAPSAAGESLRDFILGAWTLERYADHAENGSVADEPLGGDAQGFLLYTPDGFMSAQLMRQGRRSFASGHWFAPTLDELAEASHFLGYAGSYAVDEAAQSIVHRVAVSFFPNWIGQDQVRHARREGKRLVLTLDQPISSGGRMVTPRLTWVRPSAGDARRSAGRRA